MKKVKIFLMAAAMVLSCAAMAQNSRQGGQGGPRQAMSSQDRANREVERINQSLQLSKQQMQEVYKVAYKYAVQDSVRMVEMRAQREQGQQFDREAMMKQREAINKAKTEEYNKIFTTEQQKKYAEMLANMQQRYQGGQGGQGGARPNGGQRGGNR